MCGSVHYHDAETSVPATFHVTFPQLHHATSAEVIAPTIFILQSDRISCHTFSAISLVVDAEGLPLHASSAFT
jgi:hypothetical protein